jgi:hypothetical protein
MDPRSQTCSPAENNPPDNMLGRNRRIAFLPGIATCQKAIALQVFKDQAMSAESTRRFGNHNVAHAEPPGLHALNA